MTSVAVFDAVHAGDVQGLRRLLDATPSAVHFRDHDGNTPLHVAVLCDDVAAAEVLLGCGADVNAPSGDHPLTEESPQLTPLHMAAYSCRGDVPSALIDLLLRHGANPNARSWTGGTPLREAISRVNRGTVKALLKHGADHRGALSWASCRDRGLVEILLHHGADLNAADAAGLTPLCWAAFHGKHSIIEGLLESGADLNATIASGMSAVLAAVQGGHLDLAEQLIVRGAACPSAEGWLRCPECSNLLCRERGHCWKCKYDMRQLRFTGEGRCPCCGFRFGWDGQRCRHCLYER